MEATKGQFIRCVSIRHPLAAVFQGARSASRRAGGKGDGFHDVSDEHLQN
jgi:hypothetical protein